MFKQTRGLLNGADERGRVGESGGGGSLQGRYHRVSPTGDGCGGAGGGMLAWYRESCHEGSQMFENGGM